MNYFSKLAFAILLGSASVGTASKSGKSTEGGVSTSKSGKSTSSIDEFDCAAFITESYWAVTTEGVRVIQEGEGFVPDFANLFPAGETSCPRPTSDTPPGTSFFSCADDTIRNLAILDSTNEICTTFTAFTATTLNPANALALIPVPATRTRLLGECNACDRSTSSKSGKSR